VSTKATSLRSTIASQRSCSTSRTSSSAVVVDAERRVGRARRARLRRRKVSGGRASADQENRRLRPEARSLVDHRPDSVALLALRRGESPPQLLDLGDEHPRRAAADSTLARLDSKTVLSSSTRRCRTTFSSYCGGELGTRHHDRRLVRTHALRDGTHARSIKVGGDGADGLELFHLGRREP
jgi:hypothetical protein